MSRGTRPNIVFFLADDMGAWALQCAGNKEIHTPNLDALAANGLRCENFFCASPVCSPARASIISGRIPSQHGVHDYIRSGNVNKEELAEAIRSNPAFNDERIAIDYLAGQATYTEFLKEAGYSCALSGKWHLGNSHVPQKGFERWFAIARGGCTYKKPEILVDGNVSFEDGYVTDFITDQAVTFLDELSQETPPFYLGVHYTAPHFPWEHSEHPEEFISLYDGCPFNQVPDLPPHKSQINTSPYGTGDRRKYLLQGYYAAVSAMDAGIGKILQRLDDLGIKDDTLIIFMSDNGMNMGHHGVWGKGNATFPLNLFDTSVKVPAIFSHLGSIPTGQVTMELLSQYDIFPTLLDYVGLKNPEKSVLPGRSFVDVLKGQKSVDRESVIVYDEYGPVRMIRTKDWKYIHRYPYGPHELYDLKKDPEEADNRIEDKDCKEIRDTLRRQLGEWFAKYVRPEVDGSNAPVSGFGQLDLATPGKREGESFKGFGAEDNWYT